MNREKTGEGAYVWGVRTAANCAWILAGMAGAAAVAGQKELAVEFCRWQSMVAFGGVLVLAAPKAIEWMTGDDDFPVKELTESDRLALGKQRKKLVLALWAGLAAQLLTASL